MKKQLKRKSSEKIKQSTTKYCQTDFEESCKTTDVATNTLFEKIDLPPDTDQYVSCLCKCHDDGEIASIETCHLQLFKFSSDVDAALSSIKYQEDYDEEDYPGIDSTLDPTGPGPSN